MSAIPDRRVHAEADDGTQVVRYDRAGKWFIEYPSGSLRPCRQVRIADAVAAACGIGMTGGKVHLGLPGGSRFDTQFRQRWQALGNSNRSHGETPDA